MASSRARNSNVSRPTKKSSQQEQHFDQQPAGRWGYAFQIIYQVILSQNSFDVFLNSWIKGPFVSCNWTARNSGLLGLLFLKVVTNDEETKVNIQKWPLNNLRFNRKWMPNQRASISNPMKVKAPSTSLPYILPYRWWTISQREARLEAAGCQIFHMFADESGSMLPLFNNLFLGALVKVLLSHSRFWDMDYPCEAYQINSLDHKTMNSHCVCQGCGFYT